MAGIDQLITRREIMSEERNVTPVENDLTERMDPYEWMDVTIKVAQETQGHLVVPVVSTCETDLGN